MYSQLVEARPKRRRSSRLLQKKTSPEFNENLRVDAATLASSLQLKEQQRDYIYSLMALVMKSGLLSIGVVSLVKLGFASHQRVERHAELSSIVEVESVRLSSLQSRFDRLFTIGGDRRLMDEQDQWIAPNRIRVIWR